ncbi:MAG: hypothetical protein ACR650_13965 [Methylocystis sp.]|jgi:hypothetical protein
MASIDGVYWLDHQQRPQASVEGYQKQPPAQRAPKPALAYSKVDSGQFIRTLALIALCFGVMQLPRAEKAQTNAIITTTLVTR